MGDIPEQHRLADAARPEKDDVRAFGDEAEREDALCRQAGQLVDVAKLVADKRQAFDALFDGTSDRVVFEGAGASLFEQLSRAFREPPP